MKNGPTARGLVSYRCRLFKTSRCILACAAIALRCGIAVLPAHQAHAGDGACLQRGVGRARVMLTVLDWAAACQLSGNAVPTPHTSPPPRPTSHTCAATPGAQAAIRAAHGQAPQGAAAALRRCACSSCAQKASRQCVGHLRAPPVSLGISRSVGLAP